MKFLFCISTALWIDYGKYSYKERLNQIVSTVQSIHKYAPGSDIVFFDVSNDIKSIDDVYLLLKISGGKFFPMSEDPDIGEFFKYQPSESESQKKLGEKVYSGSRNLEKAIGEAYLTKCIVNYAEANKDKYDRVFKMTGRYRLSKEFTTVDYSQLSGKFVARKRTDWDRPILPTRIWSFDTSIIDKMIDFANDVLKLVVNDDGGSFNVIEWTILECLKRQQIPLCEVTGCIGVEGNMFDGHYIYE